MIDEHFDAFQQVYDERFPAKYGYWRPIVQQSVAAFLKCGDPRRWLLVRREMGVPDEELGSDRWSLDHLFLDQDAMPTLVEVKRSSDTRIRREVVGKMLDYAANAVAHWSIDQIIAEFRTSTC